MKFHVEGSPHLPSGSGEVDKNPVWIYRIDDKAAGLEPVANGG
jgi:hypothetical protein